MYKDDSSSLQLKQYPILWDLLLVTNGDCHLQNLVNVRIWISFQGCTGQQIIERGLPSTLVGSRYR